MHIFPNANRRALSLKNGPGITWVKGKGKEWEEPIEAVKFALIKQLNYPFGKARRFARKVEKFTSFIPHKEIYEGIEISTYETALPIIAQTTNFNDLSVLKNLDNKKDKDKVRLLLDIAKANLDLSCASYLDCQSVYGNELTWQIFGKAVSGSKEDLSKINRILEFEDIPKSSGDGLPRK